MSTTYTEEVKLYHHLAALIEQGAINLETDDIRVALFDNNHVFDQAHTKWSDIKANEVVGDGYDEGGQTIVHDGAKLTEEINLGRYSFGKNAIDTEWPNSTVSARYKVLYVFQDAGEGVPHDDSLLIGSWKFDSVLSVENGTAIIEWSSTGIFRFRMNP